MPNRKRQSQSPVNRVAATGTHGPRVWANLEKARYVGSSLHKSRRDTTYNLHPPVNPRGGKSLCDDLRSVSLKEATKLFRDGIRLEMVSAKLVRGLPARVWAVDQTGEPYVAYLGSDGPFYHGFRIYKDERMRTYIIREWRERNRITS